MYVVLNTAVIDTFKKHLCLEYGTVYYVEQELREGAIRVKVKMRRTDAMNLFTFFKSEYTEVLPITLPKIHLKSLV